MAVNNTARGATIQGDWRWKPQPSEAPVARRARSPPARASKGAAWYTIVSSKKGKQGYLTQKAARAQILAEGIASTILLDEKGSVGRLYGAKTTPHMFVIDPEGTLIYMGAIDDKPSSDADDIPTSRNLVAAALDEAMAGKLVTTPSSKSYGCSVKY